MTKLGIPYAFLSALLFGASTPFAKILLDQTHPVMLAGILYLGSGIGLSAWLLVRRALNTTQNEAPLTKQDVPALSGAILFGGIIAPILLMLGTSLIPASSASLLLNLEGVCTTFLAWFVFKENFDRRIFIGMIFIVCGGIVLTAAPALATDQSYTFLGAALVAAACLSWGIDNNLTRQVSGGDPVQIAALKGIFAGGITVTTATLLGFGLPSPTSAAIAGSVGLIGYGISLILFILALRHLGTARTGAYFSTAPFVGAVIAFILLKETPDTSFWIAALLMAAGVFLHLTESHNHEHTHEEMEHSHRHTHDEHHQHAHDFPWDGKEPHTHPHKHTRLTHSHPHYPDIHHRHKH